MNYNEPDKVNNEQRKHNEHFHDCCEIQYYPKMNHLYYEIENNNSLSNEEIEKKKEEWEFLLFSMHEIFDCKYDTHKAVYYPSVSPLCELGKLVDNIKQLKNERFYDSIPLSVENIIEKLINFTNNAETKYIKNYSKINDSIGNEIINEIETIISKLKRQYIDEIIKKDFD